jgi:hypothetical protein
MEATPVNSIVTGYWYLIATHVDKLSDRRQRRDLNAGIYGLISALVTLCSCPIADIKQWGGEAVRHIVHIASCTKFHMLVDFSPCYLLEKPNAGDFLVRIDDLARGGRSYGPRSRGHHDTTYIGRKVGAETVVVAATALLELIYRYTGTHPKVLILEYLKQDPSILTAAEIVDLQKICPP